MPGDFKRLDDAIAAGRHPQMMREKMSGNDARAEEAECVDGHDQSHDRNNGRKCACEHLQKVGAHSRPQNWKYRNSDVSQESSKMAVAATPPSAAKRAVGDQSSPNFAGATVPRTGRYARMICCVFGRRSEERRVGKE